MNPKNISSTYLHFAQSMGVNELSVSDTFWQQLAEGKRPDLERGSLMTAFTFSKAWETWERHPAGDELVMLLSGAVTLVLELDGMERRVELRLPGDFFLVPGGTWHTARTDVETTLLFLTPGAGTEHKQVRD